MRQRITTKLYLIGDYENGIFKKTKTKTKPKNLCFSEDSLKGKRLILSHKTKPENVQKKEQALHERGKSNDLHTHTHPQSPGNYRYNLPTRHLEGSLYTLVPKEMTVLMALAGSHS